MLYKYLIENYKPNEPIFMKDIKLPLSQTNIRQILKNLCESNKLKRFSPGIYYLPRTTKLKNAVTLSPATVAVSKYINRNGNIQGYYTGYTLANQLGISTQVPFVLEIVTNNTASKRRKINLNGQQIIVQKPRCKITNDNFTVLQFLDILKDLDKYFQISSKRIFEILKRYVQTNKISIKTIEQYINLYPSKTFRNLYEAEKNHVFA